MPTKEYARWFTARRDGQPRTAKKLAGEWAAEIDPGKAEIFVEGKLDIPVSADRAATDPELPESFDDLLSSEGDPLVTRITDDEKWGSGQVIVVTNGSFVLNYPLVNHEHRKLAGKLVAECGQTGRVVFIESGPDGPAVLDKEPASSGGPLDLLKVWPLGPILMHLALLGIIFCLARSPIFGRPKELPEPPTADFGKHVAALGDLLATRTTATPSSVLKYADCPGSQKVAPEKTWRAVLVMELGRNDECRKGRRGYDFRHYELSSPSPSAASSSAGSLRR
jgi:hypothetical protein